LKVRWTREAERDRDDVWEYIVRDNPPEASAMDELFSEAVA
jgi:plasmid stabilization system protein ParE